jgi:hypothetical protein
VAVSAEVVWDQGLDIDYGRVLSAEPEARLAVLGVDTAIAQREVNRSKPNVTNEYGVVIPSPPAECIGRDCIFRNGQQECELTRHHLHSTGPDYVKDSKLAEKFRDLAILTVWLPECVHKDHHSRFEINVPIPHPKIMRQSKHEASIIRNLIGNYRNLKNNEKLLAQEASENGQRGLEKARKKFLEVREGLMDGIHDIRVIPEELITGALLLVAPEYPSTRIVKSENFALPGVLTKDEIPVVLSNAREITAQAA